MGRPLADYSLASSPLVSPGLSIASNNLPAISRISSSVILAIDLTGAAQTIAFARVVRHYCLPCRSPAVMPLLVYCFRRLPSLIAFVTNDIVLGEAQARGPGHPPGHWRGG